MLASAPIWKGIEEGSDEGEAEDGVSSVKGAVRKELKRESLILGPAVNILPRAVKRKQSLRSGPERISIREDCNERTGEICSYPKRNMRQIEIS